MFVRPANGIIMVAMGPADTIELIHISYYVKVNNFS